MTSGIGHDILYGFDVPEDAREFLASLYDSAHISRSEAQEILELSLTRGVEDWYYLLDCARSLQRSACRGTASWDRADLLDCVRQVRTGDVAQNQYASPWEATDRLLEQAKEEASQELDLPPSSIEAVKSNQRKTKTENGGTIQNAANTSHYWYQAGSATEQTVSSRQQWISPYSSVVGGTQASEAKALLDINRTGDLSPQNIIKSPTKAPRQISPKKHTKAIVSPFFASKPPEPKKPSPKKPPPGVISCIPFPSLQAPRFGIIQELEAKDPFWLLIVVTFLIKTKGVAAIPVFQKLKQRFPTKGDLADLDNANEIVDIIRHLGLGQNRLAMIQKYARIFLEYPPQPGIRFRVKGYSINEDLPCERDSLPHAEYASTPVIDPESWEIGHMTQGKYAIDSWRIFCRDVLLGRAEDYNGKGRAPEFQPEWMRVLPADKELRAFLRWMWMREGWEWDPATGDKTVLRAELQRAVEEGRVEWDDTGGLRILHEPR